MMCFNTGSTPAHRIARAIVLDWLTCGNPDASWEELFTEWKTERDSMHEKLKANKIGTPVTASSHPQLLGSFRHPAYETFDIVEKDGGLTFVYGDFEAKLVEEADGSITGYSGELDGLTPAGIELFPQPNGDMLLREPDCGGLKLQFVKE